MREAFLDTCRVERAKLEASLREIDILEQMIRCQTPR